MQTQSDAVSHFLTHSCFSFLYWKKKKGLLGTQHRHIHILHLLNVLVNTSFFFPPPVTCIRWKYSCQQTETVYS